MKDLCAKHRRKGTWKWRICAAHGIGVAKWENACPRCDLELNKIALKWRFPKTWRRRFEAYKNLQIERGVRL